MKKENEDAIIIICSAPYSKRLKEKCFLNIVGKPTLQHIFDRIQNVGIKTFLALPDNLSLPYIYKYKNIVNKYPFVNIFYGDADSPLLRMVQLVETKYAFRKKPKYIIRITHDDILIDGKTLLDLLDEVRKQNAGYGISPSIIEGAGVEVIALENLLKANKEHSDPIEYISYFVKGESCPNSKVVIVCPRREIVRPYRLTLDYYEDYVVLETILRKVGVDAPLDNICEYLDMNPSILNYNKMPEVTVYTCVRNGEKFINQTINSVLTSHQDEYIIIDDHSDDDTLHYILKYYGDQKIKVMANDKTLGLASSSNKAIENARGKYVMRVDCDDILKPNIINVMKKEIEKTESVICYANYDEIDEDGKIIRKNVDAKEKHHAGCALMNKRWLNEIRFKEGIKHWDSLELYNRIRNKFKITYINEPLWYYRVHKDSLSNFNKKERQKLKLTLIH